MIMILFGLPGTGKSYLARQLAADTRALYLNTDVIRDKMNKRGAYDDKTRHEVYERMLEEINRSSAKEKMVIVDGTFNSKIFRYMFNKRSWELERYLYYIEMKTAEDEVKKRMEDDRSYSEADYSVYEKLKATFDFMPEEHLVLHSDELELNEMKAKVKDLIYGKRTDPKAVRNMQLQ